MWVRFDKAFDWSPAEHKGRVTIAYKASTVLNVPTPAGKAAIGAGKATKVFAPRKEAHNGDQNGSG